jgi:hypothetical protein
MKNKESEIKTAVDFTSSPQDIEAILAAAKGFDGVEDISEPTALDASRALNAGLTLEMVEHALAFITIVFKTGTAALGFFKTVREEMKARGGTVVVSEPASGKTLGSIEAQTVDDAIGKILPP